MVRYFLAIIFFIFVFSIHVVEGETRIPQLSDEQQKYCQYMKNSWYTDCKVFKKVHYPKAIHRYIVEGCDGIGAGCGVYVYAYHRQDCKGDIKEITYEELWTQREKGEKTEVYWNKGIFLYEAEYVPKDFAGFTVERKPGKLVFFKEEMGKGRAWFSCEVLKK